MARERRRKRAGRIRIWLGLGAALIAAIFAIRLVIFVLFPPPPLDGKIEGWMTPRYVSRAAHIPPEDLAPILGLKPEGGKRETIDDIARRLGIPTADLIAQIEAIRLPETPNE